MKHSPANRNAPNDRSYAECEDTVGGMAEAATPFLPGPWVDLGAHPLGETSADGLAEHVPLRQGGPDGMHRCRSGLDAPDRVTLDAGSCGGGIAGAPQHAMKRSFDLVFGVVALIVFLPLMACIALVLWIEGGPVFYEQMRVGRARKRFRCLKFRTMKCGAEAMLLRLLAKDPVALAEWREHQKLTKDPRITITGRFLRETSLDELPQLFNVLRGEMSLVGPRPIVAPEVRGYDCDRAYYESAAFKAYARCLPGITGLWQVSGRNGKTHAQRVLMDREYVNRWSLWLDLKILWRTVWVVLGRSGR